jgi:ABC-2 type transport system ATP-binding protein
MARYAIRLTELTKDYPIGFWRPRPVRALDQVTLDVEPGEVLGYLGPNGAGKTTTLKLLMQLIYPTSGRAEILGRPAGDIEAKRRLGYLPELPYFYDNLTAEELLVYFGGLFGLAPAVARKRSSTLLDRVGIGAERRRRLRRYSKGMLQRVGIAQALVNDPEVVFLDEPMSGLDPVGRRDTRELIQSLRGEGRTVFFSSHILSDAEALCTRVAIMVKGRLVSTGRLAELAFEVQGWELVVSGGKRRDLVDLGLDSVTTTVSDGRHVIELPFDRPPDQVLPDLSRLRFRVVSLTPRHESLEDYFMRLVARRQAPAA